MHTARGHRSRDRRPTSSLAANFIHVRGRHQLGTIDYNPIVPSLGPGRRPNDVDGRAGTSASVLQYTSFGESWYRGPDDFAEQAVQRTVSAPRLVHALEGRGHVHGLSERVPPREQRRRPRPRRIPRACRSASIPRASEGPATHDQRHRLVVSGLYQFPFGLQVAAIVTAASGRPFTPLAGADLNGDGDGGAFPSDRARRDPADPGAASAATARPCLHR